MFRWSVPKIRMSISWKFALYFSKSVVEERLLVLLLWLLLVVHFLVMKNSVLKTFSKKFETKTFHKTHDT